MVKVIRRWYITVPLLIAVMAIAGCSSATGDEGAQSGGAGLVPGSGSARPVNGLTQSDGSGSVTIDVEWLGEQNGLLTFQVSMNTHSVDLDGYDLGDLAALRDDQGNQYRPNAWGSAPGGHHRQGTLTFTVPASLDQGQAEYIEMVIHDIAGIRERVLRWELA